MQKDEVERFKKRLGYVPAPEPLASNGFMILGVLRGAGDAFHVETGNGAEELISPLRLKPEEAKVILQRSVHWHNVCIYPV